MHKFFYEEDIKIIDSNNNHFILKEFDYNENIQNVVEYYLKIYNLIKNIQHINYNKPNKNLQCNNDNFFSIEMKGFKKWKMKSLKLKMAY